MRGGDRGRVVQATSISAEVIRYAMRLYFRFMLSLRDIEESMAQRGIEVSYETIRCWVNKFGPAIAANLRRRWPMPTGWWHLDEMVVKVGERRMFLWRAVDGEGEVLDMLVQKRRNKAVALKLLRKLLKAQGVRPGMITTDELASYRAAAKALKPQERHRPGGMRENNRAESRTCQSDDGSGGRRSSKARAQLSASSPLTPPSITPSTSSPSDPPIDAPPIPGRGSTGVGGGDVRRLTVMVGEGALRPSRVKLSTPRFYWAGRTRIPIMTGQV